MVPKPSFIPRSPHRQTLASNDQLPMPGPRLACPPTRAKQHEKTTNPASDLGGGLFIGNVGAASNPENLKHVTTVISLHKPIPHAYFKPVTLERITYINLHATSDTQKTFILGPIKEAFSRLQSAGHPRTLIHCQMGQSRAGSMAIGLLLYTLKYSPENLPEPLQKLTEEKDPTQIFKGIHRYVKDRHPTTQPNASFMLQLKLLSLLLFHSDREGAMRALENRLKAEKSPWIGDQEPFDPQKFPKEAMIGFNPEL